MDSSLSHALMFKPRRLSAPYEPLIHLPPLIWLIQQLSPRVFVQLGVAEGNLFLAACQGIAEAGMETRCYGVLEPGGSTSSTGLSSPVPDMGGKPAAPALAQGAGQGLIGWHKAHFASFSWLLSMYTSHALNNFDAGTIDLLMLDSGNTAPKMLEDFDAWQVKLSARGIVLVLDIDKPDSASATTWKTLTGQFKGNTFSVTPGLGGVCVGEQALRHWQETAGKNLTMQTMALLADRGQALLDAQSRVELGEEVHHWKTRADELESALVRAEEAERQRIAASASQQQAADALGALQEKHEALSAELDHLRGEHRAAAQEVNRLSAALHAMQESSCWRMTAPVRWVGGSIKQAGASADVLSRSIRWHGGLMQATKRGFEVLRSEGVGGFRSRFQSPAQQAQASPTAGHLPGQPPEPAQYHQWLADNDPTDEVAMTALKARLEAAGLTTTFSVVMPVYNPPLDYLKQAIESVQQQVYPHWELCIADDASPRQDVRDMLSEMAAADPRIKLVFCENNGGISVASNAALGIATGDFIALLDNDDLLPPHALAYMAMAIAERPDAGLLYSDEDKISEANIRRDPYFKSEFNYELFLAQNMISHLGVYRRDVVEKLGGFRKGFEGAQDWDLALRTLDEIGAERIVHIPRVLYHWRVLPGSTALAVEEKTYALTAQEKAVSAHLERIGRSDSVVSRVPGFIGLIRVRHSLPDPAPLVSIVIPTRDRFELISKCVDSILEKTLYPNYEIIVVDNGTTDRRTLDYLDSLASKPAVQVLPADIPFNFSTLVNLGVEAARGEYVVLLNNDIEIIEPDWMGEMLSFAIQPGVGCVGARLWYPDRTIQHAGVVLGMGGVAGHVHIGAPAGVPGYFGRAVVHQVYSVVTAASLMVSKAIYQQVGGFDEALKVAFNDVDFCIKVREAGYRNIYDPFAEFIHHESASRGSDMEGEKLARFIGEVELMTERWGHFFPCDPAYNPNLALVRGDFSLSEQSRLQKGEVFQHRPGVTMPGD